jgi:hypothetical protein
LPELLYRLSDQLGILKPLFFLEHFLKSVDFHDDISSEEGSFLTFGEEILHCQVNLRLYGLYFLLLFEKSFVEIGFKFLKLFSLEL